MARKSPTPYSFGSGFVQDHGTIRVIAQIDELADAGSSASRIMKWVAKDEKWSQFSFEWSAVRVCVIAEPLQLFVLGPDGEVLVGSSRGDTRETIDETKEGPQGRGPLRDLRRIGDQLYVAGMSRQVYRRSGVGSWSHRDEGVVLPLGSKSVAGFNSIDGVSEDDFYAVGFGGEIWRCLKGRWRKIESPTNVVLHRVRVIRTDLVYACGQEGVLLRGTGDAWEQIDHSVTENDLWDIEWYRDRLYAAHDDGLFVLTSADDLEAVDFGTRAEITCRHLHSDDGVLLSSGPKDVLYTADGDKWRDITP
jgi:hypothetical protein